jgi:L-seryl-tRNA(Ser) seleniumtransferase/D-glucosaminate-6-phosphate ammonia-lyase
MSSPYESLGLGKVINASGKMTALGGTAQTDRVAEAQAAAARHHVDLVRLRHLAGERIAQRAGAEAGTITTGAAAGIAIGVAALITGTDDDAIRALPDSGGRPNEILLQSGHDVDFGAKVSQMIRLGGGSPVLVGKPAHVDVDEFEQAITDRTAGLMYVQSHHTRQKVGVSLAELVTLGRKRNLPVLVDAAAEEDLTGYIAMGADLVTYSGGKAIGGPTAGFIVGTKPLVDACERQQIGIARAMKVGKEQIIGLLTALADYPSQAGWPARLETLAVGLGDLAGIRVSVESDLAGRDIERVGIRMDSIGELKALTRSLATGDPSVRTRNHQIEEGLVLFDLREVKDEDVPVIVERVADSLQSLTRRGAHEQDG